MTDRTCSVDDCEDRARRRGWCNRHYSRWLRHGDPLIFRPDATRGCSIMGCGRDHYGRGWCTVHYARWSKTGDPLGLRPHFSPLAGKSGAANPSWLGDDVGYGGVHLRLRKDPASNYPCAHCLGRAEQWAYDHEDPDERISDEGLAYSTSGRRHYIPLCVSCHKRFDLGHEATRQG